MGGGGSQSQDSGVCGTIQISVIGQATRGKTLLVHTTSEYGKDIVTNVIMQDAQGNVQAFQTNTPFKGYGTVQVPQDSDVPLILLASADGCETGRYQLNELKGELISPSSSGPKLVIKGLPEEENVNTLISGLLADESGSVLNGRDKAVKITRPDGTIVETNTDSNGYFKFYADHVGAYSIVAEVDGFKKSDNTTVNVRTPRKPLDIRVFRKGSSDFVETGTAYQGVAYSITLYADGLIINETLNATIELNGAEMKAEFIDGWTTYVPNSLGQLKVKVDESEGYESAKLSLDVVQGMDFSGVMFAIGGFGVVAFIVLMVYLFVWRRKPKRDEGLGFRPGKVGGSPQLEDIEIDDEPSFG